ncbi:glycoside hydrolase family 3 N-terminal domain-containing protein [Halpernia frigidisoli]|uniref:Beta-glucosidase n=1 Tax=Halpernia frigidisoli TaxID=1125876 RepID=A0A1I3CZE4_9FLAO|nr:glycoside hydrolase family 3 N-terminal domain-containing protein [Halpernia frigidisoli]SFH79827.1 beta-glucosidase [Halpernia frigidisoli]
MIKHSLQKTAKASLFTALIISGSSLKANPIKGFLTNDPIIKVGGLKFSDLNRNGKLDKFEDYRLPIEDRIKDILSKMTDDEKASLLIGSGIPGFSTGATAFDPSQDKSKVPGAAGGTNPIKRLGIPAVIVSDGPAGVRINPTRPDDKNTYYTTAFPVGTCLASTWNENLIKNVGKAMGNEVKEYGIDVLLSPAMNIHRNPLCGRNFEYYSEDPLLSGKIAAAMVNGVQSNGVGTSIKHFVANNQERNRMDVNEHISERALREIYLKSFEIAVKESQPWTVMSSYNLVNGTYTSARKDLLTTILRNEWGFKGLVMSDWFGGYSDFSGENSAFKKDATSDVTKQLVAGNDLLMPGMPNQKAAILENMKNGKLSKEIVDLDVSRILALILKSPVMNKYKYSNKPDLKENAKITREAAAEGTILLKNDKNTLPYNSKKNPLAVFGITSYNFISGGSGSGKVNQAYTVSLIDGLTNSGFSIDKNLESLYKPYVDEQGAIEAARMKKDGILAIPKRIPELEVSKAVISSQANVAEMAMITIGRNAGENADRSVDDDFNLAPDEVNLINNVSEAFHAKGKKVVVILNIGGVIETASWRDKVDAIILPWQGGQEGGNSVADIFTGKVNPSGRLTMTFPVKYEDTPSAKNWLGTPPGNKPKDVNYEEGIYVGYRYFNTFKVKPAYEFGYGLSYTNFEYSDLKLSSTKFSGKMEVKVTVKNTGKTAGKEVVQLYLSAPDKSTDKPSEELKAFGKTKLLQPGESETLTLTLNSDQLASFISKRNSWIADAGNYKISVGSSSTNIKKTANFYVGKEIIVQKTNPAFAEDVAFTDLKSK